jgi:diacylglycerol kinase family enzyme/membrane-associated phospholipid phosphatase
MAKVRILRRPRGILEPVVRLDCDLFGRVAGGHTPWLDRGLPLLSRSANHSVLWIAIAAGLSAAGGRRGRRAATRGLASIAVTSLVVNQGIKRAVRRPRPALRNVPAARRARVAPLTTSFPSGHAASAAAFATGVAIELAPVALPLGVLAAAVGGSRVYVGVHYPLDVLVGAGMGAGIARLTGQLWPRLPQLADEAPPCQDRRLVAPKTDGAGITVVVNPSAGAMRGEDLADTLRARLPRARVTVLEDAAQLDSELEDAASGSDVLGVAGGNGSFMAAAEVALERSIPLLVLPAGTLNHLPRDLRVDDADDALDAVTSGELVGVDVATVDGRPFLNSAGFGAYPEMLAHSQRLRPRLGRWPGQLAALATTLARARPLDVALNGTRRRIWLGFVGNCRYEPSGFAPSWRPRLDDGLLDVRLALADVPFSRARLITAALTGRLPDSRAYAEQLVDELEVESSYARLRLARDGEHFEGPGDFVIAKRAQRLPVYALHRIADRKSEPSGP